MRSTSSPGIECAFRQEGVGGVGACEILDGCAQQQRRGLGRFALHTAHHLVAIGPGQKQLAYDQVYATFGESLHRFSRVQCSDHAVAACLQHELANAQRLLISIDQQNHFPGTHRLVSSCSGQWLAAHVAPAPGLPFFGQSLDGCAARRIAPIKIKGHLRRNGTCVAPGLPKQSPRHGEQKPGVGACFPGSRASLRAGRLTRAAVGCNGALR